MTIIEIDAREASALAREAKKSVAWQYRLSVSRAESMWHGLSKLFVTPASYSLDPEQL